MEITVFHNAGAGEGEWSRKRLETLCRELWLTPRYLNAKDPASLRKLRQARGHVAIVGGDGTVAKAAAVLDRTKVKVAIVPTGGGNNIARSLGVFVEPEVALSGLNRHLAVPLSVGKVSSQDWARPFIEAVGVGAIATIASHDGSDVQREEKRAAGRQQISNALVKSRPLRARITIDGTLIDEPILAFEAINIALIGPNLALAIGVERTPRQLVACWLPLGRRDRMREWLRNPRPEGSPMEAVAVEQIEIDLEDHALRIDDWLTSKRRSVRLRLRKRPLDILVPSVLP